MADTPRRQLRYLWHQMHNRCSNPAHTKYRNYGGRGIAVCARWRTFEHFYADMHPRPSADHTLDRIDNDGPYSPDNCKWSTRLEQGANMRTNHRLTLHGRTQTIAQWARELGVPVQRIHTRLSRGRSDLEALTAPRNHYHQRRISARSRLVEFQGRSQTVTAWAKELGLHRNTFNNRIERGWTIERAITQSRQPHQT